MRLLVLPVFDSVIMDEHPIFWVMDPPRLTYWMGIHYDTIEDGPNKKSHLLLSFLVRFVLLFSAFYRQEFSLSKILLHYFICFIWIITPVVKINVLIQETKTMAYHSSRAWIPFAYRCVTRYTVFTPIKYTTTPCNCWTHYSSCSSNGWVEFWAEPVIFISVDSNFIFRAWLCALALLHWLLC